MVTGAGGSIGSELCRQLARLGPARLVLVDHSEPALFEVDRELARERGFLAGVPVVADVKDGVKMRQVFAKYRPASGLRFVVDRYPMRRAAQAIGSTPRALFELLRGNGGPASTILLQLIEALAVFAGEVEGAVRFRQPYL